MFIKLNLLKIFSEISELIFVKLYLQAQIASYLGKATVG